MSRAIRKQILDSLKTLQKANYLLKKLFTAEKEKQLLELLTECQNCAIEMGNQIETAYGENLDSVHRLEDYCETIYQISENFNLPLKRKKMYELSCKQLKQLEYQLEEELPNKLVAVFLPYKASMWDSLESVWMAANEDEKCDTYVMPIPYFNKNSDGSLGEMHYEGADFPEYIPIMDWQQYSLEEAHPDIIFIHNPYDQYNYVTTVHPNFYASKIAKYTDKLVYIPYFVHQNDMVKDIYCVLPGTIYADTVILQSEKVREQYIRYYEEACQDLLEVQGKNAVEQKFQALGSPKFDVAITKENEIPDEWKSFLNQNKKVIFFNTHLNSIMAGKSKQFLKKLDWVFNFFQGREDVVLLWRPHPLMVETAKSMNPEAVEPYLQLVDRYQQQKIGIYDDSKDLHRAINLADIYYGDKSSVVELFRHQGKPVMIMEHEVIGVPDEQDVR